MTKQALIYKGILLGLVLFSFYSCSKQEYKPDLTGIEVEVELKHFEQDLFNIDTNNTLSQLKELEAKHTAFTDIFFQQLFPVYDSILFPEGPAEIINGFLADSLVRSMYAKSQDLYKDLNGEDFELAFRYFKYYFPNREIPDITTFISEYTISNFIYGDNSLAVGLDFFLGQDYPYLELNPGNPNFSAYLSKHYNKDYIIRNTLVPLIDDMNANKADRKLIDYMLDNGKELYILDALLPEVSDTVIHQYSAEQMDWVVQNEANIYAHLIDKELLYSTIWQDFRKLVDHSPNSPGMPVEAPGRTANYIGYRMVEAYMRNNPETSFEDLIKLDNAQEFLARSRYRPGK